MTRTYSRTRVALSAVAAVLLASGCLNMQKRDHYDIPKVELPDRYRHLDADQATLAQETEAAPKSVPQSISKWWQHFENEELNQLVEDAFAHNYELRAAIHRISQAAALLGIAEAGEWPEISGTFDTEIEAPDQGIGNNTNPNIQSQRLIQIGVEANYEVDLWGKNRAATEAAVERAWSSIFARETVALTLTGDLVQRFMEYLSIQDRIRVARDQEALLNNLLQAVIDRMEGGEATILQVAQQNAAVAASRAVIPILKLQRDQALNAIALLVGKAPSEINIKSSSLSEITFPTINPGLPSRLLMRRPDLRQAEAELIAADADIDAARAELFPTLDLTAGIGYGARTFSSLLSPTSLFWNLGQTLTQIIFDRRSRISQVHFNQARQLELVQNYMQALYLAMRETEDALVGIKFLSERRLRQLEAVQAAQEAFDLSVESYDIGAVDYLTLLDTERTLRNNEDEFHQVEFQRYVASLDLFRAIAGTMESDFVIKTGIRTPPPSIPEFDSDGKSTQFVSGVRSTNTEDNIYAFYLDEPAIDPTRALVPHLHEVGYWIHLGSIWSERALDRHWRRLKLTFPELLENREAVIDREPHPNERGTWASMMLGPFEVSGEAKDLCTAFRSKGYGCEILHRAK